MNTPDSTLLLMGLTGSGKTTYLVGLDAILDNQNDPNGLKHAQLSAERAYLQPLKEQWLRGEVLERTKRQQPPPHQLLVEHYATGKRAGLSIPDLAGETFDAQFQTRCVSQELWERIERANGILLFVHCDHNGDHALLEDPGLMDAMLPASGEATTRAPEPVNDWKLEDACQQVKLVDLLQFISESPRGQNLLRVAVMISAWDLIEQAYKTKSPAAKEIPNDPEQFLARRWPLLKQFLDNNGETFECRVFGVSARGGGNSKEETARLTALECCSDRVILVDGKHRSNDLTRPLRWLLGINEPEEFTHG